MQYNSYTIQAHFPLPINLLCCIYFPTNITFPCLVGISLFAWGVLNSTSIRFLIYHAHFKGEVIDKGKIFCIAFSFYCQYYCWYPRQIHTKTTAGLKVLIGHITSRSWNIGKGSGGMRQNGLPQCSDMCISMFMLIWCFISACNTLWPTCPIHGMHCWNVSFSVDSIGSRSDPGLQGGSCHRAELCCALFSGNAEVQHQGASFPRTFSRLTSASSLGKPFWFFSFFSF